MLDVELNKSVVIIIFLSQLWRLSSELHNDIDLQPDFKIHF